MTAGFLNADFKVSVTIAAFSDQILGSGNWINYSLN